MTLIPAQKPVEAVLPRTGRLPDDIESRIFNLLLCDHQRKTCGTITLLSKDHHRRFAPRFWHTMIVDSYTFKHFPAWLKSPNKVNRYIKRVVFGDEPSMKDSSWYRPGLAQYQPDKLFPKVEQVILTRAFTADYARTLLADGYADPPDNSELFINIGYSDLARWTILQCGPGLRVFWDLDFPFTAPTWKRFIEGYEYRQDTPYKAIGKSGVVRGMIDQLLGSGDPSCDAELAWGIKSHISVLTLYNYHTLQRIPSDLYCDVLHVVLSPYALDAGTHAVAYFGNKMPWIACEVTMEYILAVNANKVLVQGLEDVDDAELGQAAHESVSGYNRGGHRTEDRVAAKTRFGPRHLARHFVDALQPCPSGGVGGTGGNGDKLDLEYFDRLERGSRIPARLPEGSVKTYTPTEKGHFDPDVAKTTAWLKCPHDYQLCPDFTGYYDPHRSFWECQRDDPLPFSDDDDDAGDMFSLMRQVSKKTGFGSEQRGKMSMMYGVRMSGILNLDGFK